MNGYTFIQIKLMIYFLVSKSNKKLYINKEGHPKLDAPLLKENGNNILSHNLMLHHRPKLTRGINFERRNQK